MANRAHPLPADGLTLDAARVELRRAVHRANELQEMAEAGPTQIGECDDCHQGGRDLYDDPDEPGAGWQYCRECLGRRAEACARRLARAAERCRQAGGTLCRSCRDYYDKRRGSCGCQEPREVQ